MRAIVLFLLKTGECLTQHILINRQTLPSVPLGKEKPRQFLFQKNVGLCETKTIIKFHNRIL